MPLASLIRVRQVSDQLPAIIPPGALTLPTDTYIVPSLIADLGDAASWRFVEFFTANIENPHTRRVYRPGILPPGRKRSAPTSSIVLRFLEI